MTPLSSLSTLNQARTFLFTIIASSKISIYINVALLLTLLFCLPTQSIASQLTHIDSHELGDSNGKQTAIPTAISMASSSTGKQPRRVNQEKQHQLESKPFSTLGQTREEHQALKRASLPKSPNTIDKLNAVKANSFYHDSYSIYKAYSYLLDDIDEDGYYQRFTVTFDADYYPTSYLEHTQVYAELYLSHNGGPWVHYYSTEIFTLFSDTDEDEYEVTTRLEQGFIAGEYDILIDLYDATYDELVVSYNANDDNALYALPLESAEFDYYESPQVVHSHGGSFAIFWLFMLLATYLLRIKYFKYKTKIRIEQSSDNIALT